MARGLQNLRIAFDEPQLTHFAWMALIHAFCARLGLKRLLQNALRPGPRSRTYRPADLLLALLYGIIVGLDRINATQILQYNGAFQRIAGFRQFPDATALRRFLKRMRPRHIRQLVRLHDQLRQAVFARPRPRSSLVFDLDSVVLVLYGHAEGARVGYNFFGFVREHDYTDGEIRKVAYHLANRCLFHTREEAERAYRTYPLTL